MTKKTVGKVNKEQDEKLQGFIDAIKTLEEKHGYQVVPMIQYTDQGLYPTVGTRKTPEKKEAK